MNNNEITKDFATLVDLRPLIHYASQKNLSQKQIDVLGKLVEVSGNEDCIAMFNQKFKNNEEELKLQ